MLASKVCCARAPSGLRRVVVGEAVIFPTDAPNALTPRAQPRCPRVHAAPNFFALVEVPAWRFQSRHGGAVSDRRRLIESSSIAPLNSYSSTSASKTCCQSDFVFCRWISPGNRTRSSSDPRGGCRSARAFSPPRPSAGG